VPRINFQISTSSITTHWPHHVIISSPSSSNATAIDQHHDAPHHGRAHNLHATSFSFASGRAQFLYHEDSTVQMVMMMLFDSFTPEMILSIRASTVDHHTADQSHRGGTANHRSRSVVMEPPTPTQPPRGLEALSVGGGTLAGAVAWRR
jgi:hypothetical protein